MGNAIRVPRPQVPGRLEFKVATQLLGGISILLSCMQWDCLYNYNSLC